jgi:phosphoribosyl-ATP pyrophosphohydrolase/phosphoribosyl-AMP cyclohydrolase/histidinol dehydrogenase
MARPPKRREARKIRKPKAQSPADSHQIMLIPRIEGTSIGGGQAEVDEHVRRLAIVGCVHVSYDSCCPAQCDDYLNFIHAISCWVGPFSMDAHDAVHWLDAGADRAVIELRDISDASLEKMEKWVEEVPGVRERVVASVKVPPVQEYARLASSLLRLRKSVGGILVDFGSGDLSQAQALQLAELMHNDRGREGATDYLDITFGSELASAALVGELHSKYTVNVSCRSHVVMEGSTVEQGGPQGVNAASAFVACLRTDRSDGLYTTVVCDASGVALGLVYSNPESIAAALGCGRGVYWSRSRGGLWRKGDSSGAWQELLQLSVDCDSDAIKATVNQRGAPPAFCHLNRRTCWGGDQGLGALERTLAARRAAAPPGSYTARLFNDPQLLRNKLVEEAQELAEAEDPDHIASEAADLSYFMLVRCAAAGVSVADVEKWLDRRALKLKRRPGNAKAHRIEAGDAILSSAAKK